VPCVLEDAALQARLVRTGRLKIVMRLLKFIGDDSVEAARMALAAGQQNKLFQFVDLVFHNQGAEESGWVDDEYLRRIGEAAGLDVDRALEARESGAVTAELDAAVEQGKAVGLESTPWFLIATGNGKPRRLEMDALTADAAIEALERTVLPQ
jgi:protein-disulfide isomerase